MMNEAPLPVRIPVAELTVAAYRSVFGRLGLLLELAWLPLLILLGIAVMPAWLPMVAPGLGDNAALSNLTDIVQLAAGGLCLNAFAVRWHQAGLFPGKASAAHPWLKPWLRFLLYTFAFYVVNLALLAGAMLLSGNVADQPRQALALLALMAAAIPAWLAMVRFSLLFPAAAYGQPLSPLAAWRALGGNTWRVVACGFLSGAPLVLVVVLVLGLVFSALDIQIGDFQNDAAAPPMGLYLLEGVIDTVVNFLVVALGASILVEAYKRLVLARES